jgi:hypothetical protein
MTDYITANDIVKITGTNYNTALEWLKVIYDRKFGKTYVVDRSKFINWANENNINLVEQEPIQ